MPDFKLNPASIVDFLSHSDEPRFKFIKTGIITAPGVPWADKCSAYSERLFQTGLGLFAEKHLTLTPGAAEFLRLACSALFYEPPVLSPREGPRQRIPVESLPLVGEVVLRKTVDLIAANLQEQGIEMANIPFWALFAALDATAQAELAAFSCESGFICWNCK